ncbi:MAG: ATP-binding protein [Gemmatimonadales bacterium]
MLRAFSRLSIQWKLPLLVAAVMLAVTGALLFTAYREVRRAASAAADERAQNIVGRAAASLTIASRQSEEEAHRLASLPQARLYFRAPNPGALARLHLAIDSMAGVDTTVLAIGLRDTLGRVIQLAGKHAESIRGLHLMELVRIAHSADSALVGPLQAVGDTLFYPTVAVVADPGRVLGYLVRWRAVLPRPGAREQIAAIIGAGSTLIVGSEGDGWNDQAGPTRQPTLPLEPTSKAIRYDDSVDGTRFVAAVGRDPVSGWYTVLQVPDSIVGAPAHRFITDVGLVALGIITLGLLLVWGLGHRITVPLRRLTTAAEVMGAGEFPTRVAPGTDDEVGRLAVAFNQMADQVEQEVNARSVSETQWRLLFKNNPHPMWVYEPGSLCFLAVNDAAIAGYGFSREDFLAMTIDQIRPPEQVAAMLQHVADAPQENLVTGVFRHRRKDGKYFDVEVTGNAVEFNGKAARLVLAQDVSARRALESQLRQAQKMEAVGRLAGGVAHDFNNLLAVIMTYTELVRLDTPDSDVHASDLDEVKAAAERAHALTRQLLTFSRQSVLQPSVIDPNQTVAGIDQMLRRLIGEDIEVVTRLSPDAGSIRVDPGQFEQILMNLAVNARDAMPTGGALTIRTEGVAIDEASRLLHGLPQPGRYVVISISDSGTGMSPETRARIFEPFFTTKDVGKGTGLGLATVYALVTQSGGSVTVYSELGFGTTFRLYFPSEMPIGAPPPLAIAPSVTVGGSETILLVEDDAAVRGAATEVLQRLGYTVLAAQGAPDALEQLHNHPAQLHLVLSDVVMPGADGPALIAQLRELRPDLKALLMSGYLGDAISSRGIMSSGIPFLEKPFTVDRLGRKVREVLDG